MLKFERTASHSICFIVAFFVSSSKGEFVDQIDSCCALTVRHYFMLQLCRIVLPYVINVFLPDRVGKRELEVVEDDLP